MEKLSLTYSGSSPAKQLTDADLRNGGFKSVGTYDLKNPESSQSFSRQRSNIGPEQEYYVTDLAAAGDPQKVTLWVRQKLTINQK